MIFSVDNFCTIWSHPKTSTQDFISFDQQLPPGGLSANHSYVHDAKGEHANGEWHEDNHPRNNRQINPTLPSGFLFYTRLCLNRKRVL